MKILAKRAAKISQKPYKENVFDWVFNRIRETRKDNYILLPGQKYAYRTDRIQIGD